MLLAFCVLVLATLTSKAQNRTPGRVVRVAASSDLEPVMPIFAQVFERDTGIKLVVTFGSSDTLTNQIIKGAPIDIFLGADFTFPEKIVAAGLADTSAPVPYAKGTLVLLARKDFAVSPLSVDLLTDPRVKRIAVSDEFHAPIGRAAVSELRALKVYETVKPKLLIEENGSQTAQVVESGKAEVGFVSMALANSGHYKQIANFVRVPSLYPEIRQCAVVLKTSEHAADAKVFLNWLRSAKVQEHLPEFGLDPVQ